MWKIKFKCKTGGQESRVKFYEMDEAKSFARCNNFEIVEWECI